MPRLTIAQGPLVGEKRSSHSLTEEYAKADPVYVAKTMVALPESPKPWPSLTAPAGTAANLLALPADPWGWKLWLARFVTYLSHVS